MSNVSLSFENIFLNQTNETSLDEYDLFLDDDDSERSLPLAIIIVIIMMIYLLLVVTILSGISTSL